MKKKTHLLTSTAFANSIVGLDMIHFQPQDTQLKGRTAKFESAGREKSGMGFRPGRWAIKR